MKNETFLLSVSNIQQLYFGGLKLICFKPVSATNNFWPTQIYFLSVTCFLIFIFTRTLFGCTQVSQGPGLVSGRHSVTSDASVTSQLEQLRLSSVEREFRRRVAEYHRQNGEDSNSVCCTKIVVSIVKILNIYTMLSCTHL